MYDELFGNRLRFPKLSLGQMQTAKAGGMTAAPGVATAGPVQARIAQKEAIVDQLAAQQADRNSATKELYIQKQGAEIFQDPITGECFKAYPFVLTKADFTTYVNVASAETTIATYTVPNGMEFGFRAVQGGMAGINLDRQAPYLYASIKDVTPALLAAGLARLKIYDSTENDLKGQPYTGDVSEMNAGDPIDWNKRVFYSTRRPIRAKGGDHINLTLRSATVWVPANSNFVFRCLQLSKQ